MASLSTRALRAVREPRGRPSHTPAPGHAPGRAEPRGRAGPRRPAASPARGAAGPPPPPAPSGRAGAAPVGPEGGSHRPFTVTEQLILASDRRWSPLTVGVVAETDAVIDLERLRRSVRRSMRSHPMARALITPGAGSAPGWRFPPGAEPLGEPVHEIDVAADGADGADGGAAADAGSGGAVWRALETLSSRPFDLRSSPPVRFLLAHRPTGDVVGLVAHHAALDGVSALALLQEVLAGCRVDRPGRLSAGAGGPATAAVPAPPPATASPAPSAGSAAPAARPVSGRRSRHLVPTGPRRARGFGMYCVDLPVPRGLPLADGRRMTVNDLLISAAHLAAERWNTERGRPTGTVRVRMPMDAAPASSAGTARSAGNLAGQAMIGTSAADRAAPQRLARRVVEQTVDAKRTPWRWADAPATAAVTVAMSVLPGPLGRVALRGAVAATRGFLTPTLAVSNIGRPDTPPATDGTAPTITGLSFTATTGMPQGLLICAAGGADRLRLMFCHHRRLFDPAGVRRFAEVYQVALVEIAGSLAAALK